MDPLTVTLQLVNTLAQIGLTMIESLPLVQRTEYAKQVYDDLQRWRPIVEHFLPPLKP